MQRRDFSRNMYNIFLEKIDLYKYLLYLLTI